MLQQDEIIEMARQAGFRYTGNFSVDKGESLSCFQADLEAFAKLVAAKERERIIAMEKDLAASPALFATMKEWSGYKHGIETFIAAIRARGEQHEQ